jgi:cobalt-zinc-cadmium efflux system outer membrane protein
MNLRIVTGVALAVLLPAVSASAQKPGTAPPATRRYIDAANGLLLEQAIARALEQEPSLRAARSQVEAAQGMRTQASLKPNPSVSFEWRDEPSGSDSQATVALEWPLDLFRQSGRVSVAERQIITAELGVADRRRLLAAQVRAQYGEALAAVRDLGLLDELADATRRQHLLLRARTEEGATPPLERDLLDVELRRLESERLLQEGRVDAAFFELKRVMGMRADATLTLRETFDDLMQRELSAAPQVVETPLVADGRADVREAAAQIAVADAKIDRAERDGRFDVNLFASYMRMDAGFPQRAFAADGALVPIRGVFHYLSAGATVSLPLLNRNDGEIAAARAERTSAAAAFEAARLTAETEVAAARARDQHARQAVALYSTNARTLARQNLDVVDQSYDLGRVTVFDVLAERRRYLDIERSYTEALRAAYESRTALIRALGDVQ